jgi:hypothetical protein
MKKLLDGGFEVKFEQRPDSKHFQILALIANDHLASASSNLDKFIKKHQTCFAQDTELGLSPEQPVLKDFIQTLCFQLKVKLLCKSAPKLIESVEKKGREVE